MMFRRIRTNIPIKFFSAAQKRVRTVGILLVLLFATAWRVMGQPVSDFVAPSVACLNQSIQLTNQSTGATSYFWDFNQGDLLLTPTAQSLGNLGGNIPYGVETAFDGNQWFGFIASRGNNTLIRLDFGNSLSNTPVATELSGIAGAPNDIEIVFAENEWFAFVSGANQVTRYDFGNSLTNTPTATTVISGVGGSDSGLDLTYDGSHWYIAYSIGTSSQVGVARLNTIRSIPGVADKSLHPVNGGTQVIGDIKLIFSQGHWFGYTVSYSGGNQLLRLSYGNDPLSSPSVANISGTSLSGVSPFGVDVLPDNGNHVAFVSTDQGNLFRINLGNDLNQTPTVVSDLGRLSTLSNTLKIKFQKQESRWFGFAVSWAANTVFRISFPEANVPVSIPFSTNASPAISYTGSGNYGISLVSRAGASASEKHMSILVENKPAPTIDFNLDGICQPHPITFSSSSNQTLISSVWNFGDGNSSSAVQPLHTYASTGTYEPVLQIQASNNCFNQLKKTISIVAPPVASFTLPAASPFCTNETYLFTNTSGFDAAFTPAWQWEVNGMTISSSQNLSIAFATTASQNINLIASVPGCTSNFQQTIASLQSGPNANFSFSGICEDAQTMFTNTTSGSADSYSWNFGDGNFSSDVHPVHVYSLPGTYLTTLSASSANGCVNTKTSSVTIRSVPQSNFTLDLPPFSCSGSPSQFRDATPPLSDSNITSWLWQFGDAANGTGTGSQPLYTYTQAGNYTVQLTTITNFGCTSSVQKNIAILPSPTVDFSSTPACVNQLTTFTDNTSPTATAWQWTIGSSFYSVKNPVHTFNVPGTYSVQLRATASNQCMGTRTQTIVVPVLPLLDFTVSNNCVNRSTLFQESNPGGTDPATAWSWTFGDSGIGSGSPVTHTYASTGNYNVSMNVTRQSGCQYSFSKVVSVTSGPAASFQASPTIGPPPLVVTFTNTSQQATSYVWRFNDLANSTTTQESPLFTFSEFGTFPVELTAMDNNGCASTATQSVFAVLAQPDGAALHARLVPGNSALTRRLEVTIRNHGNIPLSNPFVLISLAGGSQVREVVPAILFPSDEVTTTLISELIPGSDFICAELQLAGDVNLFNNRVCVNLESTSRFFDPYPSPAAEYVFVDWISLAGEPIQIQLYNTQGQTSTLLSLNSEEGLNRLKIDVAGLSPGIYFLQWSDRKQQITRRISIQR
jgi:PKD repeat protein